MGYRTVLYVRVMTLCRHGISGEMAFSACVQIGRFFSDEEVFRQATVGSVYSLSFADAKATQ